MKEKETYWFKRKRYGYGWTPASKEGWASLIVYVLTTLVFTLLLLDGSSSEGIPAELWIWFAIFTAISALFAHFVRKHAPPAKWRWGKKDTDNPDEDC